MEERERFKSCAQIISAIIGGLAVIIAALLSHESTIAWLTQPFRTKTVTIYASPDFSGSSIYLAGNEMLTFSEAKSMAGIGDETTDQLIKSFFSFYFGDMPKDIEFQKATLTIPCSITGLPDSLGDIKLIEYNYGGYSQMVFYGAPLNSRSITFTSQNLIGSCRLKGKYDFSDSTLLNIIQEGWPKEWAQFVFQFKENWIIANQSIDAVVITNLPWLEIKYLEKPK